jgi:hypothetical protein
VENLLDKCSQDSWRYLNESGVIFENNKSNFYYDKYKIDGLCLEEYILTKDIKYPYSILFEVENQFYEFKLKRDFINNEIKHLTYMKDTHGDYNEFWSKLIIISNKKKSIIFNEVQNFENSIKNYIDLLCIKIQVKYWYPLDEIGVIFFDNKSQFYYQKYYINNLDLGEYVKRKSIPNINLILFEIENKFASFEFRKNFIDNEISYLKIRKDIGYQEQFMFLNKEKSKLLNEFKIFENSLKSYIDKLCYENQSKYDWYKLECSYTNSMICNINNFEKILSEVEDIKFSIYKPYIYNNIEVSNNENYYLFYKFMNDNLIHEFYNNYDKLQKIIKNSNLQDFDIILIQKLYDINYAVLQQIYHNINNIDNKFINNEGKDLDDFKQALIEFNLYIADYFFKGLVEDQINIYNKCLLFYKDSLKKIFYNFPNYKENSNYLQYNKFNNELNNLIHLDYLKDILFINFNSINNISLIELKLNNLLELINSNVSNNLIDELINNIVINCDNILVLNELAFYNKKGLYKEYYLLLCDLLNIDYKDKINFDLFKEALANVKNFKEISHLQISHMQGR